MLQLPRRLDDIRAVFSVVNWRDLEAQIDAETRARLVIVGPVNAGKSSLFNVLQGRDISDVSPVPGTTRQLVTESFGPFTLIDTPGLGEASGNDRTRIAHEAIQHADLVILLLDAVAGVREADVQIYRQIKQDGKAALVVLNKLDLIRNRERASVLSDAEYKLETSVIGISAKTGEGVAERVMRAVIEMQPNIAVAVGRALPDYRQSAVNRVIREAATVAGGIALEPVPLIDVPLLISHQLRMVLRIAAIYGEPLNVQHARELISTIAGGVGIRYVGEQAAKFIPGPGWLVSAAFAVGGTVAIGKAADAYFESEKKLDARQLRAMYKRIRNRKQTTTDDERI
jgi:small GTP-binding protein